VSSIQLFDLFCGNPRLRCPPILFKGLTASKLRLLQFPHGGSFKLSLRPPVPCSPIPALIPTLLLSLLWCCLSWPRDLGPGPQNSGGSWYLVPWVLYQVVVLALEISDHVWLCQCLCILAACLFGQLFNLALWPPSRKNLQSYPHKWRSKKPSITSTSTHLTHSH